MSDRKVAGRGRPPLPHLTTAVVVALAVLLCAPAHAAAEEYEIPDPIIKAYSPKGLSVSIPDSEGVELFAFHGNVNRELGEREAGEMSVDIRKKKGGLWTYENTQRRLKVGDVVNYWLYVQRFGRGYEQLGQTFVVSELVPKGFVANPDERPFQGGNYNGGDRFPAGGQQNYNNGDRFPTTGQQNYNTGSGDRFPTTGQQNYNTGSGDRFPTTDQQNYNSGDRYPTDSSQNYNSGDRFPTTDQTGQQNYNQGSGTYPGGQVSTGNVPYNPSPTVGSPSTTQTGDVDFNPTLSGVVPSISPIVAVPGSGAVGLPLTGDLFTATPPPTPTPPAACDLSPTEVNGKPVCKGQVVFEDNFSNLDLSRWSHEVKISGAPDYEFCIYTQNPENSFTQKGFLHLSPTLTNDKYGADFVRTGKLQLEGCTAGAPNSDSCSREAMFSYILPPIVAARINTKNSFSFKYGTIEIRARLPRGDWIYPELWLQPTREEYGPGLASGRVVLAMARGNRRLTGSAPEHIDLSGKVMVAGALAGNINEGSATAKRKIFAKRSELGLWTEQFHNYTLLWTPDTMAFSVDGIEIGVARPEDVGGLIHGERDPWSQGSRIAPFDKEFYLSLGLAVGGVHAFPDGCRSGNHDKPWKNTGAKAMLNFWNNREVWHSTWNGQSDLLIDSVRVTALNN